VSGGIPSPCPCCGAYSLAPDVQTVTLVAVADVLVVKALERVGSFLLRGQRSRFMQARDTPLHMVHTIWNAPDDLTSKALRGAWDVVPALVNNHGCCGVPASDIVRTLDGYVHDLVLTGTPHTLDGIDGLTCRLESHLGLALPEHAHV
jgi:hypothetical protein